MSTDRTRLALVLADRYTIERELGQGGMATVYLAHDIKHDRGVAIKVLREDLAASLGPERFLREIEIAAKLLHPHIVPLLDSGSADGFLFYVMPFVEGESLRARLTREGELPVPEAVRLLVEIADALEHAHAKGVVHRDIKPDNVMLMGRHALVADFGIAKAISDATGRHALTTRSVTLGTPAYMSPEQAAADPHVDHRSDIYSVGALAYELLAGRPPFVGATQQQVLAAQVTQAPVPISTLRPGVTPELDHLVMTCLAKRPADRWQTATELLAHLQPLAIATGITPVGGVLPQSRTRRHVGWVAGLAVVAMAAVYLGFRERPLVIASGALLPITTEPGLEIEPSISPDAKFVAYMAGPLGRMRIWIRPVDGGETRALISDTSRHQRSPKWSHDQGRILFVDKDGIKDVSSSGGPERLLVQRSVLSAEWGATDHQVVFAQNDSLFVHDIDTHDTRVVGYLAGELHSCTMSPSGIWIACVSGNAAFIYGNNYNFGNSAPTALAVFPAGGGTPTTFGDRRSIMYQSPIWAPDSKALYFVSDRLGGRRDVFAARISGRGAIEEEPTPVMACTNAQTISLSRDGGRLACSVYTVRAALLAVQIPPAGKVAGIASADTITSGAQSIEGMHVSWDGKYLVYDSNIRGRPAVWRIALAGGTPELLSTDSSSAFGGDLSPDGTELAYYSLETGKRDLVVSSLRGGKPRRLYFGPADNTYPRWAPDGKSLVFFHSMDGPVEPAFVTHRGADSNWGAPIKVSDSLTRPEWSPDGHSLAGANFGIGAIAKISFPGGVPRNIYMPDTATGHPRAWAVAWGDNGRSILFKSVARGQTSFWSIDSAGHNPRRLLQLPLDRLSNRPDFATDGKRLIFAVQDQQSDISMVEIKRP